MESMPENIDPCVTPMPELRTGIDYCPAYQSGITGQSREWQEQTSIPGQKYGQQMVTRRVRVIQCQQCGWAVSESSGKDLVGNQPHLIELGLPERCPRGHIHSWRKVRRFGNRLDFDCCGLVNYRNGPKHRPCRLKSSIWFGGYHGFLKQRSATPYGQTRNQILRALSCHPGGASLREIVSDTGLKQTTILGCLSRMLKARYAYVSRSETPQPLPVGLGHRYRLSDRGWEFIAWGVETGIFGVDHE